MAFTFSFFAAICSSLSNLIFHKNTLHPNSSGNTHFFLFCFYLCSLFFSFILYPSIWKTPFNTLSFGLGGCVGLLNALIMLWTARALQQGPAGLTFAFQNASAIFPGLLLFLLFGSNFGFSFSYFQLIGIFLALLGLFLGTKKTSKQNNLLKWLKYALAIFIIQMFALTLIQGRCLLFDCQAFPIQEGDDAWFMPGQFGISCLVLAFLFSRNNKKLFTHEAVYGCLGGLFNSATTFLLLVATKSALPLQKIILFPCFAVATMILCNIWANRLYKENFNFRTNLLCALGIFIACSGTLI